MRRRIWLAESQAVIAALHERGGWTAAHLAARVRVGARAADTPDSGRKWRSTFDIVAVPGPETELLREVLSAVRGSPQRTRGAA